MGLELQLFWINLKRYKHDTLLDKKNIPYMESRLVMVNKRVNNLFHS